jgi:stage III sporulation protein AF
MNFSAWVLSIVGIVILTLIVDIILPEGQTNKYIKSVFAVITVFVIALPIPSLFNGDIDIGGVLKNEQAGVIDTAFIENLMQERAAVVKDELLKEYKTNGIDNVEVEISYKADVKFNIEKIFINVKNSVIVGSDKNINIKEKVLSITINLLDISDENVVFL